MRKALRAILSQPKAVFGGGFILLLILIAIFAPWIAPKDPLEQDLMLGTLPPIGNSGAEPGYFFGTDDLGRDIFSRVVYGARVSLIVGVLVAAVSVAVGLVVGLVSGYYRWLDSIVMRIMDGLMAIPSILLAIALVSLSGASLLAVVVAIAIPEIPRVVRLVRSIVLSIREEPYVEAAISVGTPVPKILYRHVLPNTIAPLIVQATFICGSAILLEAILSFLGVGIPPETPTWGNIMAEGRGVFQLLPHNILIPGVFLTLTVLAVNMLGDGLRDTLDPRMKL